MTDSVNGKEHVMDEEVFNLSIRKFLKVVGIGSQREIERAVAQAIAGGKITDTDLFPASVRLVVEGLDIDVSFDGEIKLQ
jgi:hypothetical protein